LRRNLNICLQIKKRSPEASILIIADSPVAPFFKMPSKCDFVKIPTIVKVDTGVWRPDRLSMPYRELLAIRSEIIKNVALSFQPHIFMVDHMPHGALGELAMPLEFIKRHSPHTRIVLGIRDILGASNVIHQQWQNEGAFAAADTFYDAINIYGCADVYDVIAEYGFPAALAKKAAYSGYVCREDSAEPALSDKVLRDLFANDHRKFVLVTGGGGADASYFMDQFIDAVRLLRRELAFNAFVSTGPFMHKDQRGLLLSKARGLPIVVSRMGQDSIRFLRRADLVISMAGYNTVSEVLRFRKNALIVPRSGPSAEQTIRTRIMSERGWFSTIHPNQLTAERFAELILYKLQDGHGMDESALPDLNGATRTAAALLSKIRDSFVEQQIQPREHA
jgi:predicted glycosyltransferase